MTATTLLFPVLLAASLTTVALAAAPPATLPASAPPMFMASDKPACGPGRGPGLGPGPGRGAAPPDLALTDAQDDKLFALEHAAAPERRARAKAMAHAREGLRAMAQSGRFDAAAADALATELGQAVAAEERERARLHASLVAQLTPEQRAALQARTAPCAHPPMHHEGGFHAPRD